YWVENPSENYGFELELDSYGNGSFADRSYKGEANNLNFIEFEFKVIVPLEYAFNDTTNLGSITVNNLESASGPYKYFIDASPIGSLMEIWNSIEDKSSYDSTSFFSGDTLGKKIVFSELYQGKYYVSIFDNNSNKIFDDSIVISPNFFFRDSSDISVNSSNEILKSVGSFSDGKLGFYRSLSDAEIYGGLVFDVVSVGEFSLGFNKFIDPTASSTTDIEFGISVDAAGNYRAIKNNYLETTILGSLISDDQIAIFRDKDEFVIAINGIENYRTHNSSLYGEELAFDAIIISATVTLKPRYYIGSFYRPRPQVNISYPECGDVFGDITVKRDRASTIGFCSLTNIEGGDPRTLVGEPYIFSDVPIGIYKLVVNYIEPGPLGGFPVVHSFLEDVAIGYVVEWEELVNTYKSELNTIALGPGAIPLSYSGSCNSTNISVTGESNWLQFETRLAPGFFGYPTMNQTLKLKNSSGTNLFSLSSSLLTGSRYLCFDLGLGVSFGPILGSPSAKWRINQDGNDFSLYKENVLQITPSGRDELFDINLSLSSTARYVRTIASFCTASQNEYIAKTKITTDGGYYLAIDKKVKFQYTGEYNISDLDYILTDAEGIEVLETDFALEKVEVPSSEEKKNADNRYIIDFESLSSGFYLLKIINAEGEEHFLRIKL
uniref:hypothetical protein n=1 Tax=Crocinitomix catalasitica TaxID=184607 RepID=UPI0004869EBD